MTHAPKPARLTGPHRADPPGLDCRALLEELGLGDAVPPTAAQWTALLERLGPSTATGARAEADVGWSSYENLFRIAPTATVQQDYTKVEEWMDSLRADGVTDIDDRLQGDLDRICEVVPLIHITAVNPAAARMIGIPEEDLLGPIDPRIVNPGSLASWTSQFRAVWNRLPLSEVVFEGATARGEVYDARATLAAPLIGGQPDFSRAVFTIVDITDLRNEERRMASLIEAKDRFLATVSHEIRTPLTSVLGFAELLRDPDPTLSGDDRRLMLAAISEQAQELANLVEDLLVASRSEIGKLSISDIRFDVGAQIRTILEARAGDDPQWTSDDETARWWSQGDPIRFRQILRNLLTNAERYGGPDVRVDVRVSGDGVIVEVSDDGAGIPGHQHDRIFDTYHTAHATPGRPGSVGIGLSISRQLAELMGGSVDYRRVDGRSVFAVTLRRADPPAT